MELTACQHQHAYIAHENVGTALLDAVRVYVDMTSSKRSVLYMHDFRPHVRLASCMIFILILIIAVFIIHNFRLHVRVRLSCIFIFILITIVSLYYHAN